MPFEYLDRIVFRYDASLKEVLERFNETAIHTEKSGFGIIINESGKCIGVVSDGDIRRKLVDNVPIASPVEVAINKEFSFVSENDNAHKILRQFDKKVCNLPVLDQNNIPIPIFKICRFISFKTKNYSCSGSCKSKLFRWWY